MAALAICAVTAALLKDRTDTQAPAPVTPDQPPPADPGMIPLTIPEIKRLLAALTTRPLPRWLVIHWDAWTRRHQARSRGSPYLTGVPSIRPLRAVRLEPACRPLRRPGCYPARAHLP